MRKMISDVVRDKIIKARKWRTDSSLSEGIYLTDEEASELWSRLSWVEAEIKKLKDTFNKSIKEVERRIKFFKI